MSEPATNKDVEEARDQVLESLANLKELHARQAEGWRQQQSAQHDEQTSLLKFIRDCVRWLRGRPL